LADTTHGEEMHGAILLFPFLFLQVLLGLPLGLPPRDDEMVLFAVDSSV
jgi:hypothetical protein